MRRLCRRIDVPLEGKPRHILVVDDDPLILELITLRLNSAGYGTFCANRLLRRPVWADPDRR